MLSGSVRIDGRRIEGRFSFAAWALRLRLESVSGTPREFLFTAEPGKETLVHRGAHEVRGRSAELIEAVLGLPLNSEDMRRVRQRRFARRSRRPANYRRRRIRRSRPVSTPLLVDTRVK
jgi:hypothetical protein